MGWIAYKRFCAFKQYFGLCRDKVFITAAHRLALAVEFKLAALGGYYNRNELGRFVAVRAACNLVELKARGIAVGNEMHKPLSVSVGTRLQEEALRYSCLADTVIFVG